MKRNLHRAYSPPVLQTRLRAQDYDTFAAIGARRDVSEYALMQSVLLDFVRAETTQATEA
jgi:hypothetical protein